MTEQCQAQVQFGTSTYAMRNKSRRCANAATNGGFCGRHQRYVQTDEQKAESAAAMKALADALGISR